jgi:Ca2+/H+ antiporter, TMEM165/GDT1 family
VEALTLVLAVASVRGWRPAIVGAGSGLVLLVLIIVLVGPLLWRVPLHALRLVIGTLLLLFGLRWLRKAILRSVGYVALHDEGAIFAKEQAGLRQREVKRAPLADWGASVGAFKAVLLESIEVVFIVVAVGARPGLLPPAAAGASAACVLVLLTGIAIRRPLQNVPENTLKFGAGVLLAAFGVFWTGEGLDVHWPGGDFAIIVFGGVFLLTGLGSATLLRRRRREAA